MRYRVCSALLTLCLLLTMLASTALAAETNSYYAIRIVADGQVTEAAARLEDGDWYVHPADLPPALKAGATGSQEVNLRAVAQTLDVFYEHDDIMKAAYVWTAVPYGTDPGVAADYDRGLGFDFISQEVKALDKTAQVTSLQLRAMLRGLITELAPEKLGWFDQKVSEYDTPILRGPASLMCWYAAVCIGADDYNYHEFDNNVTGDDFWDSGSFPVDELFPDASQAQDVVVGDNTWDNEFIAGYLWNLWHKSDLSGLQVIAYDYEAHSMRTRDPLTAEDALCALARLYHSRNTGGEHVALTDTRAVNRDSAVLTDAMLAQAAETGIQTLDQLPRLTGFVLGEPGYWVREVTATEQQLRHVSQWGFSTARIMLTYQTFFNDDASTVNLDNLRLLDNLVAAAIRYDLHLNLLFFSLPGRWTAYDDVTFDSTADLDLFTNPEKQAQVKAIWAMMAQRYKDVPGAYLSFTPFWEATNKTLSTGLPEPENYDEEDVAAVQKALVDTIRAVDPDRFIIYEATATNMAQDIIRESTPSYNALKNYKNVRISYNFCENNYVYAEMTATEGEHIDHNNHGLFKPDYPLTVYAVNDAIDQNHGPLILAGGLPQGTTLRFYLESVQGEGTLTVSDDRGALHQEELTEQTYKTGTLLSRLYPFATSEKCVDITLSADTETLTFAVTVPEEGWCYLDWSGLEIVLPEAYTQQRWYFPSRYDGEEGEPYLKPTSTILLCPNSWFGDMDVEQVVLDKENLTYTSNHIFAQSTKETVDAWGEAISKFNAQAVVRYECASFNLGTTQKAALAYYGDMLAMFTSHGMDWLSNDSFQMMGAPFVGAETVPYQGWRCLDPALLRLMQTYQGEAVPEALTASVREGAVTALVHNPEGTAQSGRVMAVAYTAAGQLRDVDMAPVELEAYGSAAARLTPKMEAGDSIKVFFLSANYLPIAACVPAG